MSTCLRCAVRLPSGDNFCSDAHYRSYREERGLPWETGRLVGNKRTLSEAEANKTASEAELSALTRINGRIGRGRPRKWLSEADRKRAERANVSKALVPVGDRRQWLHARLHELEAKYGEAQAAQLWPLCQAINAERDTLFAELWSLERHLPEGERYYWIPIRFKDGWRDQVL